MQKKSHFQIIDIARGGAIALMFIYHFCFDLNYFGIVSFYFTTDPFWLNFRTIIVSCFLFIMGVSMAIATNKSLNLKNYLKRLAIILAYAAIVSLSSYLMYPKSMIFFGILHFVAAATVLALIFTRLYWTNLILGIVIVIFSASFEFRIFDLAYLQWFGLMTHKPLTEDYVPLIPWFGVVLIGLFFGKLVFLNKSSAFSKKCQNWSTNVRIAKIFAFGGRHSLHIYMLHQPIFIGLLYIILSVTG
ncbi:Mlr1315 protein [hydrothermal vent metagenome]|uniref:Mlr1315 protein n=1 Tax=hydrothermal vent metagenome TaxID=652676 RepID=A0A3B1A6D4_9ZZZZ